MPLPYSSRGISLAMSAVCAVRKHMNPNLAICKKTLQKYCFFFDIYKSLSGKFYFANNSSVAIILRKKHNKQSDQMQ